MDRVLKTLKENANKAKSLLLTAIPQIGSMEWSETLHNLKVSVLSHLCKHTLPETLDIIFSLALHPESISLCILCNPEYFLNKFSCHLLPYQSLVKLNSHFPTNNTRPRLLETEVGRVYYLVSQIIYIVLQYITKSFFRRLTVLPLCVAYIVFKAFFSLLASLQNQN